MKSLRVLFAVVSVALGISFMAAACGDDPGLAFQPQAMGEQTMVPAGTPYYTMSGQQMVTAQPTNSFVCYISDSYLEVALLHQAGLCPDLGMAVLMASLNNGWGRPLYWHQMYAPYYDSSAYYDRYVPAAQRTVYVQHVTVFEQHYHTQIVAAESSSSAKWKGSDGKTYNGAAVQQKVKTSNASFGSGNVRSRGFSSGSQTQNSTPRPAGTSKPVATARPAPANTSSASFSSGQRTPIRTGGAISSGSIRTGTSPTGRH